MERRIHVLASFCPVRATFGDFDVHDNHAVGQFRLFAECLGDANEARRVIRSEELHLERLVGGVAHRGQQLDCGCNVLLALRELIGVVERIHKTEQVVCHLAVSRQHLFHHLGAVDDQTHGLANLNLVEWSGVHAHTHGQPTTR